MAAPTINFAGIASGIDSNALIDATVEAQRAVRTKPYQDKVAKLEETNSAFEDLTTKLSTLQTTLKQFGSLAGGGVSKQASSSSESKVTATATNAAINGSYSLTVTSLAKNHTLSFDDRYASSSEAVQSSLTGGEPAVDRTVTFQIGSGANLETVDVVVTNGSFSAADFVTAFNNSATKAEASLVNVGTASLPSYAIVINTTYPGLDKGDLNITVGASLTNMAPYSEDPAADASFTITGIGSITRSTNSIADVIPGVTFNLVANGAATVTISEDVEATQAKVQEFIDNYNDIVNFVTENNQITRDESGRDVKNIFGALASTSTDDGVLSALRNEIAAAEAATGTAIKIFSNLGITTERDGTLKFNTNTFQEAISAEPSSVSELLQNFADTVSLTGGTIDVYTRFNGIIDISVNGNKTQISDLNSRIAQAEERIQREADAMRARFARLESLIGGLQQQQTSLTSALAGLQ